MNDGSRRMGYELCIVRPSIGLCHFCAQSNSKMDGEEGDDPFDVFGGAGDSDSDDEGTAAVAAAADGQQAAAKSLVEAANARLAGKGTAADCHDAELTFDVDASTTTSSIADANDEEGTHNWQPLSPQWPNRPPLYLGPMAAACETEMGGGRGYVATRDMPPGTLLLVEKPIFQWPEEQIGHELSNLSILHIARHSDAEQITHDMEKLHPTMDAVDTFLGTCTTTDGGAASTNNDQEQAQSQNVEQIDNMMKEMKSKHQDDALLQQILDLYRQKNILRSDGRQLMEDDIFRMLLALRYNGFGTGVYLNFAIFNHEENPNCIKFAPEHKAQPMSEIRTTRAVKKGEALTLSYLDPREVSHATRRQHLWDQHRFDIGESVDASLRQFEVVAGELPNSSRDQKIDDTTYRIEKVISEFEEQLGEIRNAFSVGGYTPDQVERAKAMEVATVELVAAAIQQLNNPKHILLIRCYRLHLDAAESVLSATAIGHVDLSTKQRNGLLCRFVQSARKLLDLQQPYLGDSHVDLGRTYQDLAQGINALLSHAPKDLFALDLEGMKNFAECSKEEAKCDRGYNAIRNLYPRNTLELIKSDK